MGREGKLSGALSVTVLARDVKKVDFTWEWYLFVLFSFLLEENKVQSQLSC